MALYSTFILIRVYHPFCAFVGIEVVKFFGDFLFPGGLASGDGAMKGFHVVLEVCFIAFIQKLLYMRIVDLNIVHSAVAKFFYFLPDLSCVQLSKVEMQLFMSE